MDIRKNNFNDPDRTDERDDERLEGLGASERADRSLKDRSQYADTDAAAIRPVSNVNGDEDDEEDDDTDDLIGDEEINIDDDDLEEEDFDEDDLDDMDFDEEEEEEEDDNL